MNIAHFHSALTVVGVIAFIVMVVWVFGKKQKPEMDRHAQIPLQDDLPAKNDPDK